MARTPTFDAPKLMKQAIDVMHQTVQERRGDGKESPLVGALLWFPDGEVVTACRGELREGDHAEFTLLERKCRHRRVEDAILFATLEPCAPKARRFPKLGCAERIVQSRIKEVYVGIEDPDPLVDRKGIKYLLHNGVKVHMFEPDLQEEIRKANATFVDQAMERARKGKKKPVTVTLSALEDGVQAVERDDLSEAALERYRERAEIKDAIDSEGFARRLKRLGLLKEQNKVYVPTGFGYLLFGKEPRTAMQQAGVLGTIHYDEGTEETRDFDGPAVDIQAQAIQWIKDKLPNPILRNEAERKEERQAFLELVREGIGNALVHRDYGLRSAKCQLVVTPNRVQVKSPGLPVEPVKLEQLEAFNAPTLSRNPPLHYVFGKMKLAEERGLGLKSMRKRAKEAGLPLPAYSYEDPYLVLTLFLEAAAVISVEQPELLTQLSDPERTGWKWMVEQESFAAREYREALGLPERTARNHLEKLVGLGLLARIGEGRSTRYKVVRS